MAKRKSISKKTRFEVFKRDSFKCQYCGQSSPEVLLEVDHIKPVAEGGDNVITNLITSCRDCNRGKGKNLLDDNATLEKQRQQLEELTERRNQLEMMMNWREGLKDLDEDKLAIFIDKWDEHTNYTPTESGRRSIKKWIKNFNFDLLLDCMEISVEQYLQYNKEGKPTKESVEKAFKYIPRIAARKTKGDEEPYMKDLYYIRGIMRNRYSYVNEWQAMEYLKQAYLKGASIEGLKQVVLDCRNWTQFSNAVTDFLEGVDDD